MTSRNSTNSRPVHPCYLSVWEGNAGAEYSTWACITPTSTSKSNNGSTSATSSSSSRLPNLVTAQASTLKIYSMEESTGKLLLIHSFPNLAGSVCFLGTLRVENDDEPDSLVVGFSGHPRLAVVSVQPVPSTSLSSSPNLLLATSLIDLAPALTEHSFGSITSLEQDLIAHVSQKKKEATVCIILGGGVSVACISLRHTKPKPNTTTTMNNNPTSSAVGGGGGGFVGGDGMPNSGTTTFSGGGGGGWVAHEPYILPLHALSRSLKFGDKSKSDATAASSGPGAAAGNNAPTSKDLNQTMSTGFGDILNTTFLPGYLEPTMIMLHANPMHGHAWSGRLGRPNGTGGTRFGLIVTAISVTVTHQRSAVLWSVEVPSDAIALYAIGKDRCLVQCVNSIVSIGTSGQVQQCLAMNGWVKSTLTSRLLDMVQPNPWPFPKLSIQLDGARIAVVNDKTAFLALRCGQLYLLQHSNSWCLLPLHQTIGGTGQIANLQCWPFGEVPKALGQLLGDDKGKSSLLPTKKDVGSMEMGLVFVGSRLGDSSLLGYGLELTSVADAIKHEEALRKQQQDNGNDKVKEEEGGKQYPGQDYETILRLEEEALYAPTEQDELSGSHLIPPSSDEDETDDLYKMSGSRQNAGRKRARMSQLVVVRSLTAIDSLTALGPLGPGCEGPVAPSPHAIPADLKKTQPLGASGYVFPCGYGSSGGLALLSAPGRDDRSVIAEADCLNTKAIFNLPSRGLVLLSTAPENGGTRFLQIEESSPTGTTFKTEAGKESNGQSAYTLAEVDMDEWCTTEEDSNNPISLLEMCTVLAAAEFDADNFVLAVSFQIGQESTGSFSLIGLSDSSGHLRIKYNTAIRTPEGATLYSLTSFVPHKADGSEGGMAVACTFSSGDAIVATLDPSGHVSIHNLSPTTAMDIEGEDGDKDEEEEAAFYRNGAIVAVDAFVAPKTLFVTPLSEGRLSGTTDTTTTSNNRSSEDVGFVYDEDDMELYGESSTGIGSPPLNAADTDTVHEQRSVPDEEAAFLLVCRQSGELDVYLISDLMALGDESAPVWSSLGCGHGVNRLLPKQNTDVPKYRNPRMHRVYTREMRLFFCGPSSAEWSNVLSAPRPLLLVVETSEGDTFLYSADINTRNKSLESFSRIPLKVVTRPSQEQSRHFAKLRRKKIVGENAEFEAGPTAFRHNRMYPFHNVSGQDGLFAAVARPMWIVAERGKPTILSHRSRHVAPSGAKPRPVTGFCSGLLTKTNGGGSGFMTMHERVGRVGTQRLTVFNSIWNPSTTQSLIPGGGLFVEKIPFGVTVRRIQFIDDPKTSTGAHPLYAVLVSRELEADLSDLNNDGLSSEERQRLREEKENAKIKRQVEADLGGFDIEQEWVEEIERENCFKVETNLGGSPPIQQRAYSLWIVDAANGWMVVDSHELGEFEHGTTMQVMELTEFAAEPGSTNVEEIPDEDLSRKLFITVGTGIVDKDGEDVSSKGRVLLFEVKRADVRSLVATSQVAELQLVYEKDIGYGPVTSLSCLNSDGKSRLVIGAGADVNVEQWGNDKLTQVGFFRATMHVSDITLFKTFFLLSDAYDSLYFLVWRESDKSLTLLAKDYDPIPVYAAGLMSRGGSLSLVCHDDRQNLQFFHYAPGDAAARGGNKLVCRADFHLGSQTVALQSHFCRSSLLINSATPSSTLAALKQQDTFFGRTDDDQRLGLHFGTTDGGYGTVTPLSEPVYWRLTALQSVMVNAVESDCALSQRAWRMYRRTPRRGGCRSNERKKGVIDGDLVIQYADLALADQEDLASAIGSTVELILDNLLELRCSAMVI